MSGSGSPSHFSGEAEYFFDPSFTAEISQKMRVPKRIKVDGESDEPVINGLNLTDAWAPAEKLEMHVPEKIIVLDDAFDDIYNGHDDHFGTKSFPRELELEKAMYPPDPSMIRVQTPPRVITLDRHYYPTSGDVANNQHMDAPRRDDFDRRLDSSNLSMREMIPTDGMSTNEEVIHLRKQLSKLNRRVMAIELDNMQRQQRERIVYALGIAYFFFKTLVWLSRS